MLRRKNKEAIRIEIELDKEDFLEELNFEKAVHHPREVLTVGPDTTHTPRGRLSTDSNKRSLGIFP